MSYLVLARKYRPQTFSEVVGQEHVTRTLANAFASGRVHHAFLFCGPRGCGKTTLARIVGKALNCENGPSAEPCGTCAACASISAGSAIDYQEMDGASNRGIDAIRELTEAVRYQPAVLRKKVYVIDEVHMLTTEAFNALLKTLEEPPPHVTFVLATTEPHKLPNTILSRCQRYDFKLVPASRLAGHLTRIFDAEKLAIEAGAVSLLVRESGGSVRDALSLSDQLISYVGATAITEKHVAEVLGVADRALTRTLVRSLASGEAGTALGAVESAIERGVDEVQLARAIVRYLRDLSVLQVAPDRPELVDASDEERVELGAEARSLDRSRIAQMFERMLRCCDDLGKTLQPRLVLDCALIDVATVEPLIPLGDLVERLGELEARLTRGGAVSSASRPQPARPQPAQPAQPARPAQPSPSSSPSQPSAQAPRQPALEEPAMSMTARLEQHLEGQLDSSGGSSTRTVVSAVAEAAGRKQAPAFATGTAPGARAPAAPPIEQPLTPIAAGASAAGASAAGASTAGASTAGASTAGASTAGASTAGASTAGASTAPAASTTPNTSSGKAPNSKASDAASAKSAEPASAKDKSKPPKRKPEFADGSGVRGGESNEQRAPGRPEMAAGSGVRGGGDDGELAAAISEARAARDAALAGGVAESKNGNVPAMTGHAMSAAPGADAKTPSTSGHSSGATGDPKSGPSMPGHSSGAAGDAQAGPSMPGHSSGGDAKAGAADHVDVPPMPAHLMADVPHASESRSSTSPMKMTAPHTSGSAAMKSTASGSSVSTSAAQATSGSGPQPGSGSGHATSGSAAGSGVGSNQSSSKSGSPMKSTLPGAGVPAVKPAGVSGPVSMQPSGPVPAPSSTASGSGPTGLSEPLTAAPADLLRAWNHVLGELEARRRFTLLGPFQHARVMKWSAELIELGFPVDVHSMGEMAAEKTQIDELSTIVRELGSELGRVKITVRMLDASESNQGTRSSLEDTRAKSAMERGKRESEAREHPITKHVLQTFGAQIKEIKTDV